MTQFLPRHTTLASLTLLISIAAASGCTPNVTERDLTPATITDLTAATRAEARQPGTIIIDARTPSAFRKGHIPGARNVTIADIDKDARKRPDLAEAERIIVYGQNPGDSLATGLALRMIETGYSKTRLFRGGIDGWTASGGELVTESP